MLNDCSDSEVNNSSGTSLPDLSCTDFWFLLSLLSMASPQAELFFQHAFPISGFVTHETKQSYQGKYLMFRLCRACSAEIFLSFAFVAPVHDRGNIHSNISKGKSKQTKLYPVKARFVILKFNAD